MVNKFNAMLSFLLLVSVLSSCGAGTNSTGTISDAKTITSFSITNPTATGTIDENAKTISVTVPYATDVTTMVANFTTPGVNVKVGGTLQVSGTTPNDFTNPVVYTVTAADGTTTAYTVTVTAALNTAKAITGFSFTSPIATGTINESAKSIDVLVPPGTDVTGLIVTFITDGVSVKVGSTTQVSSITPNDFTSPVQYRVFAADGSSIAYKVHVNVAEKWKIISSVSFGTAPIRKVTFSNEKAYVAYGNEGIRILDLSDLSHPLLAGSINSPTTLGAPDFSLYNIVISDNIACVAAYPNCYGWCLAQYPGPGVIRFYNVENPADPIYLSSVQIGAEDMYVDGQYLYATWPDADSANRLYVIDFSDPANPFIRSSVQIPGAGRLAKNGNLVYVSTNDLTHFNEIVVVDVSNPANPAVIASNGTLFNISGVAHAPLALFNSFAYVADGTYGVDILDISSANTPTTITTISDFAPATGIAVAGDYLLVTHDSNTTDIYDLQTPQTPVPFKQITTDAGGNAVFVGGGHGVIAESKKLNFFYY